MTPCTCGGECDCNCGCTDLHGCSCTPGCNCECTCAHETTVVSRVAARYLEASEQIQDFWLTREDIAAICPPCADRMKQLRIRRVLASSIFSKDMLEMAIERFAARWEEMPKGWDAKSRKKLWKSIGESFESCVKKMEGKVDDSAAFCASLRDRVEKKSA